MPREVRTSIDTRQVLTPISAPRVTQVVAQPTNQLVTPAVDPELNGLIHGLATISPSLQQYAYATRFEQAKDNEKQIAAGAAAKAQGKDIPPGSPEYFKHGYMVQAGQIGAEQAANEFTNRIQTEFDWDTGDLNKFTKDHFSQDTKGITDESYLEGYNQVIPKRIEAVQAGVLKHRSEALVAKTEANAMVKLDRDMRAYVENGEAIPDVVFDTHRKDLKDAFGISGSRFNELLFASMKRIGDDGNYAIYEALKKPKPDGTPGMYYIPAWKEKIDQAQIHSQNVYLQKRSQADASLKKEREDKQDTALYDVFLKMDTDPASARMEYSRLRSEGLFSRASDLINWDTKINAASKREASAEQQDHEVTLQQGIYTGKVRPQQIVQADITPAQKRSLMTEWRQVTNDARQAAAAGQTAANSIYRTQDFRSGETYIETVLRPQASPLDPMGIGTEFARQQMATARKEFTIRAREIKKPHELQELASEIATRFLDRRKDPRVNQEVEMAGSLRYSTLEELKAASDAGLLTDPVEFENHLRYFRAAQSRDSRKAR
ncbi:hypothetical protein C8R31_104106 [Nitrosospira sp. Nsp2]|uniref:hypothetical protein n=1 Tax=Nitrosospira sp. Nsp2 TaxID=136548 RepID=UPI000D2FEF4C|nr:hypothetical protein [Nitrosospira sp. Nsp2]PTR15079.1 hypothetical protein C8R31_104106 [Nitrosospira sp. Nsp2]